MTLKNKETWLIVDDSASDRRRMTQALSAVFPDVFIITASTVAEAQDLLAQKSVNLCLLDFFLRGTTTERLIRFLRNNHHDIPVVVVSGLAGSEQRIYNAGADAVVPKIIDADAFSLVIKSAVLHARELRQMKTDRKQLRKIYLSAQTSELFQQVLNNSNGHILITSPSGMGRTDTARTLAERIRNRSSESRSHEVLFLDCGSPHSGFSFDELLFGKRQGKTFATRGLLETAMDSVLIIDDVQLLPRETLGRLRTLFQNGQGLSQGGSLIDAKKLRVIFTIASRSNTDQELQDFFTEWVQFRLDLPSYEDLLTETKEIIKFAFHRFSEQKERDLQPDKSFMRSLSQRIEKDTDKVTMRSLMRTIQDAIDKATDDGRSKVIAADLGNFECLLDAFQEPSESADSHELKLLLSPKDPIGPDAWRELYKAARSRSFEEATHLLRAIMVQYAMFKHKGNKTKVAAQLNVARQHLYKECLRNLVNNHSF